MNSPQIFLNIFKKLPDPSGNVSFQIKTPSFQRYSEERSLYFQKYNFQQNNWFLQVFQLVSASLSVYLEVPQDMAQNFITYRSSQSTHPSIQLSMYPLIHPSTYSFYFLHCSTKILRSDLLSINQTENGAGVSTPLSFTYSKFLGWHANYLYAEKYIQRLGVKCIVHCHIYLIIQISLLNLLQIQKESKLYTRISTYIT